MIAFSLFSSTALAQVQSHPLSQISGPFNVNLNASGVNITNVSYVFFGNGSTDTYLYRSGTSTLQTASTFVVPTLSLGWGNLTAFPSACPAGQFVTTVGGTLTCASPTTVIPVGNVSGGGYFGSNATQVWYGFSVPLYADQINATRINSTYGNFSFVNITNLNTTNINATTILAGTLTLGWENLTGYPSACPAGQAVTAVGDSLTCGTAGGNGSAGWTAAGSRVYNDTSGTTVGIGTYYPNSSLHVVGGSVNVTSGNYTLTGTRTGILFPDGSFQQMAETNVSQLYGYTGSSWVGLNVTSDGILRLSVSQALAPGWAISGSNIYNDTSGVKVGIGTSSPGSTLDVSGNVTVRTSGYLIINSTSSADAPLDIRGFSDTVGAGTLQLAVPNDANRWGFRVGRTTGDLSFDRYASSAWQTTPAITVLAASGNVGINTTSPQSLLHVSGSSSLLNVSNSTYSFLQVNTSGTFIDGEEVRSGGQSANATISADITTSNDSFNDATGLSVTITTTGGDVLIFFTGHISTNTADTNVYITLAKDGTNVAGTQGLANARPQSANDISPVSFVWRDAAPTSGSHTYKIQWAAASGQVETLWGNPRTSIVVMELPH